MSPKVREIFEERVKEVVVDLDPQERLEMIDLIVHAGKPERRRPSWKEHIGMAKYPLLGEDAQEWVTRTRRESDEHRERQI